MTITYNTEKNGIELRFSSKPDASVLDMLKENGFRWSGKQKMWYARKTDERVALVNSISGSEDTVSSEPNELRQEKNGEYDLFEMTRTDSIPANFDLYRIYHHHRQHPQASACQVPHVQVVYPQDRQGQHIRGDFGVPLRYRQR